MGKILLSVLLFALAVSCSGRKKEPTVLVETEQLPDTDPRQLIEERIAADARRSAAILQDAVASKVPRVAGWAAVHGNRLGIRLDEGAAVAALVDATRSDDPLLRALAWRWLADSPKSVMLPPPPDPAPGESNGTTAEEVVFANLAITSRGDETALSELLALPDECIEEVVPRGTTQKRVEQLLTLAQPYAGLELALVTAFVQARRGCYVEIVDGEERRFTSRRLLSEALKVMEITAEAPSDTQIPPRTLPKADLFERIANPLLTGRRGVVVSAAVTAKDPELRVTALDALCVLSVRPLAGDFGAAAAAIEAPTPEVAVAGARTFLLLVTRSRRPSENREIEKTDEERGVKDRR